jgi:hypothetical protein
MKMKFNWGTGIFIVIAFFLLAVVAFFIYISNLDIKLVEDNYYEKELAYQEHIDKINNTSSLTGEIEISQDAGVIIIQFPPLDTLKVSGGTVWFYRPSDPEKDFTLPLLLNDSLRQVFDISRLDQGKWMLKLDWKMGGIDYYFEEEIFIEH